MESPVTAPKLRRELSIWAVVGVSLAMLAPSASANIIPQGTASLIGRAVPLAILVGMCGSLLVAYGFIRLSQQFHHAGSVYGFVGGTLGPRAGVFSGLALLANYTLAAILTAMAAGRFGVDVLRALGMFGAVDAAPRLAEFVVAFVALGLAALVALVPVRNGTRLLLLVEVATVTLILVTAVAILAKLLGGQAPAGQTFTLEVFSLPADIDPSSLALGAVFGFFAFVGFEGAATLGEETRNPTRDIPRAILGVVLFAAIYYLVVTPIEVMGFGTSADQVAAFVASGSLLGDLGREYIAPWVGELISAGAAISAFGACAAVLVGASRLLFALSRDNPEHRGFAFTAGISRRHGTPSGALAVVVAVAVLVTLGWAAAFGASAFDIFVGTATIATLIIIVAYLMLTIGALKFLFLSGRPRARAWEIVIPVAAIAVLGYVLFRNVWPIPAGDQPAFWYAVATAAWLLGSMALVLARPGLARRVGERLAADEGLAAARS